MIVRDGAEGQAELTLEHSLTNIGRKPIETAAYEHNFYMLDGRSTGPDIAVTFPFKLEALADLKGLAEVQNSELRYLRELQTGQTAFTELRGYGDTSGDYDIRVENRKTGAGVRQTADRPMTKLMFWSIRTTVCPEAYVNVRVEPGQEAHWQIAYEFYDTTGKKQQ